MNVRQSLDEFFESKGFSCPLCLDSYSLSDKSKKPTLLSCAQHNVCIECLRSTLSPAQNIKCPICREVIVINLGNIKTNSQTISSMETIKELWESSQGNAAPLPAPSSAAAPVVVAPPQVKQLAIPATFQSYLLCDEVEKLKEEVVDLEVIFPEIIHAMKWQGVEGELRQDYRDNPSQWVTLVDTEANKILGAAWMKPIEPPRKWEVHWLGVASRDKDDYFAIYQALGQRVESLSNNNRDDWKIFSLAAYFNYDTEKDWMIHVQRKLIEMERNFDVESLHKHWGTQKKVTLFPCRKAQHTQNNFILKDNYKVQSSKTLSQVLQPLTEKYLKEIKLEVAITQWCYENNFPCNPIMEAFQRKPESFYIYTIGGRAQGFIQFEKRANEIDVLRCCLHSLSRSFAEHFIREFIDKIKPELELNTPQKRDLNYSCYGALAVYMRDAISAGQLHLHQAQ